jgi:hypothetical protein
MEFNPSQSTITKNFDKTSEISVCGISISPKEIEQPFEVTKTSIAADKLFPQKYIDTKIAISVYNYESDELYKTTPYIITDHTDIENTEKWDVELTIQDVSTETEHICTGNEFWWNCDSIEIGLLGLHPISDHYIATAVGKGHITAVYTI